MIEPIIEPPPHCCADDPAWDALQDDAQPPPVPEGLNKYSRTITQPKAQGASQAQLFGTGLREEDLGKPQVTVSEPSGVGCQRAS
jgi:hypothetical protein